MEEILMRKFKNKRSLIIFTDTLWTVQANDDSGGSGELKKIQTFMKRGFFF